MAKCANPECPDTHVQVVGLGGHWVQINEIELVGSNTAVHRETQHVFSAVTCSKRCAIAVLTPHLEREEAERERQRNLFT